MRRFVSKPGDAASLNLFQETVPPILLQDGDTVCCGRESFSSVSLSNPPNPLWGDFGSFIAQFEVLAGYFKAAAAVNTQLHYLSSLHTGYTHKVQTKA